MTYGTTAQGVIDAARRAARGAQYRVSVSPAGILALVRERDDLLTEVRDLRRRAGLDPETGKYVQPPRGRRRPLPHPDDRPTIDL